MKNRILEPSIFLNLEIVVHNDQLGFLDEAGEVRVICKDSGTEDLGRDLGEDAPSYQPGAARGLSVERHHGGTPVKRPGGLTEQITANLATPGLAEVTRIKRGQGVVQQKPA